MRAMSDLKPAIVPDIGNYKDVPVIEILVQVGDVVKKDQGLLTLESDKATMEVPAPFAGTVREIKVKLGDRVGEGATVVMIEAGEVAAVSSAVKAAAPLAAKEAAPIAAKEAAPPAAAAATPAPAPAPAPAVAPAVATTSNGAPAHASPGVRLFARELGVNLANVSAGTGRKGRIMKEDVQAYVKAALAAPVAAAASPSGLGLQLLPWPVVDFAKFGPVEVKPLSRINKIAGQNLARNWAMIPHVTQNDEADVTEMEAFRKKLGEENKELKLTPLVFLIKAVVAALKKFPRFNSSLDGDNLVFKNYYHVGIAVDTPDGLVVPVIRNCDQKGLLALAKEMGEISVKAREKKLGPGDMTGGCFSISSLGGIGGTGFTPIVNAPEVAILGVSKSQMKPVWNGASFDAKLMLPLSLSYDHRVIDGADAARFAAFIAQQLADVRRLLL